VLKWKVDENSAAFSTVSFKRVHWSPCENDLCL
jgi:hypothetical protein